MESTQSSWDGNPHITHPERSSNTKASKRKPVRDRLSDSVLLELWSIWRDNPRVPSIQSRRAWAISRNAPSRLIDSWFHRRRRTAKKVGETLHDGLYELSLQSYIVLEPLRLKQERLSPVPLDPPSDDTLVYPDGDELERIEASSDTLCDEFVVSETKMIKARAYTEALPKQDYYLPQQSSGDTNHMPEDVPDEYILELVSDDPLLPVCSQGRGGIFDGFTCVLCSRKPIRDIQKKKLRDCTSTIFCSEKDSHTAASQYIRLGAPPDTLMELSAIPFLFRTPALVAPTNVSDQGMDSWTTLENELCQLVKEETLDFSFLDVPDLTSMELLD